MSERNLVRAGFAAVAQRPGVVLAEIAWRWSFGAAAWVLLLLGAHVVLRSVSVSTAEIELARRSGIFKLADALARIGIDAWPRILRLAAALLPGLAALWIVAASAGRAATLNALLDGRARALPFRSLLALHFLRAAATLAAIVGYFGAMLLAGRVLPADPSYAVVALMIGLTIALAVAASWSVVNWFLSLAAIFMVREGEATFDAVRSSLDLFRTKARPYVALATWFGVFRSAALVAAVFLSLIAAAAPNGKAAVVLMAALALAYFALVDWLYVARLAAFLALAEAEDELSTAPAPSLPPVGFEAAGQIGLQNSGQGEISPAGDSAINS